MTRRQRNLDRLIHARFIPDPYASLLRRDRALLALRLERIRNMKRAAIIDRIVTGAKSHVTHH